MTTQPVRDAYSSKSEQYIALFDGDWRTFADETALVREHLVGVEGRVLDLGCGPGHWTAYLHARGADVTGVDLVPEFVDHARATFPGPEFRLGSMTELDVADRSVAGILSWYSTIHLPPEELDRVLADFHRMLVQDGKLVIGFFDSDDTVTAFDHAVLTAYRWPVDEFSARLAKAGFRELRRLRQQFPDRPDRRYAAIAASAR
ncbi:SAM-dependent methyltransferase [Catenuloplanes nepalensis]|uniref:SAM-dependent methyltransferase n=1 Tax=Catenuloplanes nepalensis TaxID=587533 RepID=A0ABT9MU20_9ACTN|nr:class I SAM-dependent methyltransferase [Catenuloplanes nepalensis]MDP9794932.1 SAM-dependent methyltransferase [Catenuloplanes nepalensis]